MSHCSVVESISPSLLLQVNSPEEMMRHFYWGEKHRVTRATKMNETSSRGHAALIVNLQMSPRDNDGSQACTTPPLPDR